LWVKTPGAGAFAATGLTQPGTSGSFDYTFAAGNGLYDFATKSIDKRHQRRGGPQHRPKWPSCSNTVVNGGFQQTVGASPSTLTFPMTNDLDVTLEITGATPGGTVTVSRAKPPPEPCRAALPIPNKVLDEKLTITGAAWAQAGARR
jgi:hypothetical protein